MKPQLANPESNKQRASVRHTVIVLVTVIAAVLLLFFWSVGASR